MIDVIKRFFNAATKPGMDADGPHTQHDIQVATCALFLEMAGIDEQFTREEMATILAILKEKYGLTQENADALIAEAERELKDSIDLWNFAKRINEHYSTEEKIAIIENLWRIVFVDQKMDKYENYLMHKLSDLLRLTHQQLIDAKLKVLNAG